jgi:hypothetical protein
MEMLGPTSGSDIIREYSLAGVDGVSHPWHVVFSRKAGPINRGVYPLYE